MQRGLIVFLFLALSVLSACSNTFNGLGRDLEQNGNAIQRQF